MSAVSGVIPGSARDARLPLLAAAEAPRVLFWRSGEAIDSNRFLADVARVRRWLPAGVPVLNLCEDRYAFAVCFVAVAANGQCNLLAPSRAPQAITEILDSHADSIAVAGRDDSDPGLPCLRLPAASGETHAPAQPPPIPGAQCVAIGHTSGSTGKPTPHPKSWAQMLASNARNHALLAARLGERFNLVATVPTQHMYGLEMSLLLPLGSPVAVACEQPFYAADVAASLTQIPAPRALVTTPLHLRALLDADLALPPIDAIVSATAPLDRALAAAAEARTGATVIEVFGSTETCVIAHRQTARDTAWTLHEGVSLKAQPDGTRVSAAWLPRDLSLADLVDQPDARHFHLRGRHADMLEIAGKRASLADLTRRLLAVPGVEDAAMLQLDRCHARGARRLAALVVAPDTSEREILAALARQIDPVFMPRPLHKVARLPRNAIGKLPRAALLALLEELGA